MEAPGSTSSSLTPATAETAAAMPSTTDLSRPSEKLGTHSTILDMSARGGNDLWSERLLLETAADTGQTRRQQARALTSAAKNLIANVQLLKQTLSCVNDCAVAQVSRVRLCAWPAAAEQVRKPV